MPAIATVAARPVAELGAVVAVVGAGELRRAIGVAAVSTVSLDKRHDAIYLNMHMADVLVQTRVPGTVAKWVTRCAEAEGDTVAGWLRRLLIREATMARVKAWFEPLNKCDPRVILYEGRPAHHILELLRDLSPTTSVFAVGFGEATDRPGQMIKNETYFHDATWFKEPANYRVVLGGSPRPWTIAKVMYNETAQRLELTLEVDAKYPQ